MFSQLLTLYITPVIYLYMETLQDKLRQRKASRKGRTPVMVAGD